MKILVKQIRKDRKLSLRQLEEKSLISRSTLSRIESEETSPTMDEMESMAAALKTRIQNLYESDYK